VCLKKVRFHDSSPASRVWDKSVPKGSLLDRLDSRDFLAGAVHGLYRSVSRFGIGVFKRNGGNILTPSLPTLAIKLVLK
jgi:hypothetical protein